MRPPSLSRRRTLTGAAALGVGVPLLAACGDDSSSGSPAPSASSSSAPASASSSPAATSSAPAVDALTSTGDVPVGGGTILKSEKVVVTQPVAGTFKCFTAVCTHSGCLVANVQGGTINCPCHGSTFSISDGSVRGGPAPAPLDEVAIDVEGDAISLS